MKQVFMGVGLLFVVLYVIAQTTLTRPAQDGVTRIRWATDDNPARKEQTARFHTMFPDSQVTVDPGMGGDQTKLIVQCATGTGPDVLDVYNEAQMSALVEAGVLMDLTPYAQQMGFGPESTYHSVQNALTIRGKQYRYPCNVEAHCIIYNKSIFDDHGVPYPKPDWTYEDWVHTAKQILNTPSKSGGKHIAIATMGGAGVFMDMLMGQGGRFFSPDGLTSRLDSPEAIRALNYYHDMMYKERVIPTAADANTATGQGGWGSSGMAWFSNGYAAMLPIGRWYTIQLKQYPKLMGHLGAVVLPRFPGHPSCGTVETRAAGVNIKGKHKKAALEFMRYLASSEYNKIIIDDGDAMPPNPAFAPDGKAMVNSTVPDAEFHQAFVDATNNARPIDLSPFIDQGVVDRWVTERVDKVDNNVLSPAEALHSLAAEINQTIRVNLERRPDLQLRYREVTGRPYTPDWWRTYQGHR